MKVVSFNVNSIRTRQHQLAAVVDKYQPDFIGLQETKVTDDDFPLEDIQGLGYDVAFHGQKTHYGVALMYRQTPENLYKGNPLEPEDAQRRFVAGRFNTETGPVTVINGYFPQGVKRSHPEKFPNKERFYADLSAFLAGHCDPAEQVLVIGDMNIAPLDIDIGIGDDNRKRWLKDGKCSFLPEERDWLQTLMGWGLVDTYRARYPERDDLFSWFDYRSRGFEREPKRGLRIDLILASQTLAANIVDAGIDYDIRAMERPSDHCPIWVEFKG